MVAGLTSEQLELLIQQNPLSFSQQRLWFVQQLQPDNTSFNLPFGLRLEGPLDVGVLERSFSEILRRHEALRTTFPVIDGRPIQLVGAAQALPLPLIDISHVKAEEQDAEVQRILNEVQENPFDLAKGPLVRVHVVRLGDEDHAVLVVMHHIVSDGWSMAIFMQEMLTLYQAFSQGRGSPLPELPIQYADYAQWQREWLSGEVLEEKLSYWREQLEGAPAVLDLPTDFPRPPVQTYNGLAEGVVLSRELTEGLKALSRGEGVTLFMLLLAAFQTLLFRYTNQTDIVVGTPTANRNRAETEGLIGFFINMLALRARVDGDPTFREFLKQVRQATLDGYDHQDVPFEKLVEELRPERASGHSPLVQVVFVLQNATGDSFTKNTLEKRRMTLIESNLNTSRFDLSLAVDDAEKLLMVSMAYNTDLFEAATIKQMLKQYVRLLESIVHEPGHRLAGIRLLTDTETGGLNQSDFPDAGPTRKDFENLMMEIGRI
jgi:hypothetical protein